GRALLPVHAPHAAAVAAHARRALRAAAAFRRGPPGAGVVRACRVAAALWNEGLFFEVHEVLEAVWRTAAGTERQALQGVIQIAVAYHHLAHGNRRGARSLLAEGRSRLASVPTTALPALDVAGLLAATAPWEAALARRETPAAAPPPPDAAPHGPWPPSPRAGGGPRAAPRARRGRAPAARSARTRPGVSDRAGSRTPAAPGGSARRRRRRPGDAAWRARASARGWSPRRTGGARPGCGRGPSAAAP